MKFMDLSQLYHLSLKELEHYRAIIFLIGLVVFFSVGVVFPYRTFNVARFRSLNNILLTLVNTLVLKILIPSSLLGLAVFCEFNGYGVFHTLNLSFALNVVLTVILFDLLVYWQHRIFHIVPFFWRMHRVHHSDIGFDVTTALRFHPFEIILSVFIKGIAIYITGANLFGVFFFEVLLNFSAMFNHGNFRLGSSLEKVISKFIVTPSFHRIHHSSNREETNSNYGFFLSIWDKIFSSLKSVDIKKEKTMEIGLSEFRLDSDQSLGSLLYQPFRKK